MKGRNQVKSKIENMGAPLVVHWLKPHASEAGGVGSVLGGGTKIQHAVRHGQK